MEIALDLYDRNLVPQKTFEKTFEKGSERTPARRSIAKGSSPILLPLQQNFSVSFQYSVRFTTGLLRSDNPLLAQTAQTIASQPDARPKLAIAAIDAGLLSHWPQLPEQLTDYARQHPTRMVLKAEPIVIPGGEAAKTDPAFVTQIHQAIERAGLCRHSYVLAIGGGAVLDLVGYAAATAHRGIRLIRIPTTVLAQNDSGVGVKNSVNAWGKKNFLGTFAPPYAVLNDFDFLTTLDDRDWRSGMAEAVKVALIQDAEFFDRIERQAAALARRNMAAMQQLIYHCARLHLNHIAHNGDPFEMGSSRPLDFGHWAAHRLEYLTDYRLRHGEAVAIGIALDSTYSHLAGWLPQPAWKRVISVLQALGFTLFVPELAEQLQQPQDSRSLFRGLTEFREHLGGELTVMFLQRIGQGVEVHEVDLERYRQAIALLKELESSSLV